jgi:two-component system nitrogen regulation sensor histidine kinase NtrY
MREIPDAYLYAIVAVPPTVIEALKDTEQNSNEYIALEQNRLPFQIAFALLYIGVCVVVLLCAIWMGISVATRIVTPIRQLMSTASSVSKGNLNVAVDVSQSEGDLRFLGETFNEMLGDLREQQSELVEANALMDQRARFIEAVLSGVSSSVIGLTSDGSITIANRPAEPLLGQEEQIGSNIKLHDLVPELGTIFDQAIGSGQSQYRDQIAFVTDGRERTLNVQVTIDDKEDEHGSVVMTLDDITDLVAAQRNTAWADVARRIAHEIKNPLTPIQLSAERIKRRYGKHIDENDREVFDNCTDTIIRQVGDIGRMVDEFSSFARMPKPVMVTGDIRKILRETVFMQKVGFPEITINLDMPEDAVKMVYDERLISQALINVIKNAAEAIEAVENEIAGQINVELEAGTSEHTIRIIDNGKGLPETDRQKLLEPYMTTREKGTGLGLPIVRKIFEDHGGQIELMDAPSVAKGGRGAMLVIRVPAETETTNEIVNEPSEEA